MADFNFVISKQVPLNSAAAIAGIQTGEINQTTCIDIVDMHSLYQENIDNSIHMIGDTTTPYIGYISADGPRDFQVVVSDKILYSDDDYRDVIILPYEYQLKYDHYNTSGNPADSIKITYLNGDEVPNAKFQIEYGDDTMWEDYQAMSTSMDNRYDGISWSSIPQDATSHRIRLILSEDLCYQDTTICVKYNKVKKVTPGATIDTAVDITYNNIEIINPRQIYTYNLDYRYSGGSVERLGGGSLPASGVYCKHADVNRIRVEHGSNSDTQGWYLRVRCGSFKRKIYSGSDATYEVPEGYKKQCAALDWAVSGDPIMFPRCGFISSDNVSQIDKYTIKVNEFPLYFLDTEYPNYTPYNIHDKLLNPIADIDSDSNHSQGINIYIGDVLVDNDNIIDVDMWNGIIKFNASLESTEQITATYIYRQLYWTMQLPDLCPQRNHTLLNTYDVDSSYLGYNDSIVIAVLPNQTTESIVWYTKSSNPSDTFGTGINGYSSVRYATIPAAPNKSLVAGTLKIAEVSIKYMNSTVPEIYDARVRGGGIDKDKHIWLGRKKAITRELINTESNYYSDIGLYDGQGLKKNGIILIKIPNSKVTEIKNDILVMNSSISDNDAYRSAIEIIRININRVVAAGIYYVLIDENNNLYPL